jgi:hypothetical protein
VNLLYSFSTCCGLSDLLWTFVVGYAKVHNSICIEMLRICCGLVDKFRICSGFVVDCCRFAIQQVVQQIAVQQVVQQIHNKSNKCSLSLNRWPAPMCARLCVSIQEIRVSTPGTDKAKQAFYPFYCFQGL